MRNSLALFPTHQAKFFRRKVIHLPILIKTGQFKNYLWMHYIIIRQQFIYLKRSRKDKTVSCTYASAAGSRGALASPLDF